MARTSLLFAVGMRNSTSRDRRCSYVVVVKNATGSELGDLATYLSSMGVAGCDVVVLDPAPRLQFERNGRVLRWVGRHIAVRPEHRSPDGSIDVLRAAAAVADCEKVLVAAEDVRYSPEAMAGVCDHLDRHEVVEPQEYLDPLPWWGGIEAARILVHRAVEPQADHAASVGFRRSAVSGLRGLGSRNHIHDPARCLAASGDEVHASGDIFVRRQPGELSDWVSARARQADSEFSVPIRTAFFLSLLPLIAALTLFGGFELAGGYASAVTIGSIALAVRGRMGATTYFPWRACFFAPVWVLERSVSVYWALYRRLYGTADDASRIAVPDRGRGEKVASGG